MTLTDFLNCFEGVQKKQGYWMVKCPAHDDRQASLSVKESDGKILLNCHAECKVEEIVQKLALTLSDLFTEPRQAVVAGHKQTIYEYHDTDGSYIFEKVRTVKNGEKQFFQRIKLEHGGYAPNLQSLNGKSKVLYRLPEVLKAVKDGVTIHVMEGEKAVEAARKKGGVATCQPSGAGKQGESSKWLPQHTAWLKGANVVIWADRDEVGESYARSVASALRPTALSVKVVQSKTVNLKDDAFDHLKAGYGLDEGVERPDLVPRRGLALKTIESYDLEKPDYLFGSHIRKGTINLLDADGGVGKTTFALALAASGSLGYDPITGEQIKPFRTLYFGQEDTGGELRSVYESLGGLGGFLEIWDDSFKLDDHGLQLLEETLIDGAFCFVIFDALIYYLSGVVRNTNDALELSPWLAKQRAVAQRTHASVLNLRHTGKGSLGKTPAELGIGSVQFRNSHRSQLLIRWHPDRKTHPGLRIVTHEKGSIMTPLGEPFGFSQRRDGPFGWETGIDAECFDPNNKVTKPKLDEAKRFLVELLTGKYINVVEVNRIAKERGINVEGTLKNARQELTKDGILSRPIKSGSDDGWVLHIPVKEAEYDPYLEA